MYRWLSLLCTCVVVHLFIFKWPVDGYLYKKPLCEFLNTFCWMQVQVEVTAFLGPSVTFISSQMMYVLSLWWKENFNTVWIFIMQFTTELKNRFCLNTFYVLAFCVCFFFRYWGSHQCTFWCPWWHCCSQRHQEKAGKIAVYLIINLILLFCFFYTTVNYYIFNRLYGRSMELRIRWCCPLSR